MRVLYIAKHSQKNSNDDEGAISDGFIQQTHRVFSILEKDVRKHARFIHACGADFVLFHKWLDIAFLKEIKAKKVFWFFDLVDQEDVPDRTAWRKNWMEQTIPHVDLGFCTDGDWVAKDTSGKLIKLEQGADGRIAGPGEHEGKTIPILFTGTEKNCGTKRESFVAEMKRTYGDKFVHIDNGCYGKALANKIASAQIVVAPDSPLSEAYWSNRVYMALGFGAFMLHPYSMQLSDHYEDGREIVYYHNRAHLHELIAHYLDLPKERERIAKAGLLRTYIQHLYLHRCMTMTRIIRQRLYPGGQAI